MKKHLFLVTLFTFLTALATARAQARFGTPGIFPTNTAQTSREIFQQTFGINQSGDEWKESHHDGRDKCRKGKKGKGKGHRGKHGCCCQHDCRGGNNGYGRDDQGGYGGNDRSDRDYRYSTRPYEGNGSGQRQGDGANTRAGQHTSSARVKTRPAQGSTPASTRPGGQKRSIPAPVRTRN